MRVNARPGSYPNADRSNLFGTYHLQFYQNTGPARSSAFMGMFSLINNKLRKDKDFMEMYEKAAKDGEITDEEMHRLVIEMCRVMDQIGTWDYDDGPDDDEEVLVPAP
jgi:hypothetical protein